MINNYVDQPKRVNIFHVLMIVWGCGMLPLWGLGFYYSFKEGPILIQSLVMSMAAIVVALCFIVSPFFRRAAAVIALVFSGVFTFANFVYNAYSGEMLTTGLVFAIVFFLLPSLALLLSSMPRYQAQFSARATFALDTRTWFIGGIAIFLLLVVLGGLYGLGLSL